MGVLKWFFPLAYRKPNVHKMKCCQFLESWELEENAWFLKLHETGVLKKWEWLTTLRASWDDWRVVDNKIVWPHPERR